MSHKKEIRTLEELKRISFDLVKAFKVPQIVLLKGVLAVGKTQMVKYMVEALGLKDTVSSPTFSLINFYTGGDVKVYHVDLYRIQKDEVKGNRLLGSFL